MKKSASICSVVRTLGRRVERESEITAAQIDGILIGHDIRPTLSNVLQTIDQLDCASPYNADVVRLMYQAYVRRGFKLRSESQ